MNPEAIRADVIAALNPRMIGPTDFMPYAPNVEITFRRPGQTTTVWTFSDPVIVTPWGQP